jgi:hypothetical protein
MGIKRNKTNDPGVVYREVDRIGGNGLERLYYIIFKKDGKVFEEKVGRQYADDMTTMLSCPIPTGRQALSVFRKVMRVSVGACRMRFGNSEAYREHIIQTACRRP